jgi:ribosomal protein L22
MADEKDPKDDEGAAEEKRRRRLRRRSKAESSPQPEATSAEASTDAPEPEPEPEPADPPVADEVPVAAAEPEAAPEPEPEPALAPEPEPEPAAAAAEEAPKPKPRRARRKAEEDKPAVAERERSAAKSPRPGRDYGDTPPMVRAHAKYVRTSARKARLVCDHIRGKSVPEARAILAHASRDVARDWSKLLESAVANAEHNHELIGDELRIHAVKADEGPTLKRFRPRAMGRATKIRKRTSHLSITLTPKDGVK